MSKQAKKPTAAQAIEQAKKNSLARKKRTANEVRKLCFEKINEMIENGVVACWPLLSEEHMQWGFEPVKKELEDLGYKVNIVEDENSDTPDVEISIEHLK